MAPTTRTYAEARTRAEVVVDQFDMFLKYTGISNSDRNNILKGIKNRWLEAVGVYLVNTHGQRILEAEVNVNWTLHSDYAVLTPVVRADLPGWDSGAAPEIVTIGHRFGKYAQDRGIEPSYWVRFTQAIRNDPARYHDLCPMVGVSYQSRPPEWASTPQSEQYQIPDLQELNVVVRASTG